MSLRIVPPELRIKQKSRGLYESADGRFQFQRNESSTNRDWYGKPVVRWLLIYDGLGRRTFDDLRSARAYAAALAGETTK